MPLRALVHVRDDARSFRRLLLAALALGFVALIAAGVATWKSTERSARYNALVDHTYQVRESIAAFQILLEQSETARRGFILDPAPLFLQTYRENAAALYPQLIRIEALAADNPRQQRAAARVRRLLDRVTADRDRSIVLVQSGQLAEAIVGFSRGQTVLSMRAIRMRLRAMRAEEERLLTIRTNDQAVSATAFLALLALAGVLVVGIAAVSFLTVLRYTRDLGQSRARLQELNDTLEDQVAERTTDLTRANDEIQRFAYIVSHDLRSPLVNVMGFTAELETGTRAMAELVDRAEATAPEIVTDEARFAAREDLPEAIGFIRTSTAKMDRLINAILKLSREGRRTITPEPLDMAALLASIVATLQHRLDERGATITIAPDLPRLTSDRLAIEQVFGNVIENAVKYLDPARAGRIQVRGREAGGRAIFEIEDNGRGIDPRDHARVFDLFRRSGTQDQPGEGIGLAHVRALTYRLGGTIDVESVLGQGATFRINLPLRFSDTSGLTT
ncbi:sensor histidine kinase [Sphingomonas guangdongensis]|uniref:sensor histidine kinase n=1 Tax=Sphingomonas guangdongensis TaxID=1141890 RepID=UPI001FE82403|nr:sensor histidine kinase [Sphingomonas guangdongensis]